MLSTLKIKNPFRIKRKSTNGKITVTRSFMFIFISLLFILTSFTSSAFNTKTQDTERNTFIEDIEKVVEKTNNNNLLEILKNSSNKKYDQYIQIENACGNGQRSCSRPEMPQFDWNHLKHNDELFHEDSILYQAVDATKNLKFEHESEVLLDTLHYHALWNISWTQNEIGTKILQDCRNINSGKFKGVNGAPGSVPPVIIFQKKKNNTDLDAYVIDGHHRIAAAVLCVKDNYNLQFIRLQANEDADIHNIIPDFFNKLHQFGDETNLFPGYAISGTNSSDSDIKILTVVKNSSDDASENSTSFTF